MPFGGKGRLGKLCNEDEKAFDILCRRLQAVSIQCRSTIMGGEREEEENDEEESEREGGGTTREKKEED